MLQFRYTSSLSVLLSSFNVCICADNIPLCIHAKLPCDSRLTLDPRVFAFFGHVVEETSERLQFVKNEWLLDENVLSLRKITNNLVMLTSINSVRS